MRDRGRFQELKEAPKSSRKLRAGSPVEPRWSPEELWRAPEMVLQLHDTMRPMAGLFRRD
eukprot:665751-Alexandrium_andersonii.AAC.1